MYTVRTIPADILTDARGLTLQEAFTRIMALMGREYAFARTCRVMHLMMTGVKEGEPEFLSEFTTDETARNAIMAQVCAYGFGRFRVITDEQYRSEILNRAA
ncbi:MAG: hypothetical protein V4527_12275 [Pseudomonadota bacterium]|jgi:hypothetical protein